MAKRERPRADSLSERLARAEREIKGSVSMVPPRRPRPHEEQMRRIREQAKAAPKPEPEDEPEEASLGEDEFTLAIPEDNPDDVAAALNSALAAEVPEDADLDALWDAVRQDRAGAARFLGMDPKTSSQMRDLLNRFDQLYVLREETSEGATMLVGFAGFGPITERLAALHLFLMPDQRGRGSELIPQLLEMSTRALPGRVFTVTTTDQHLGGLLRRLGFTLSYFMTWAPPQPVAPPADDNN